MRAAFRRTQWAPDIAQTHMSIVESASKCNCTRPMPKQGIAKSFAMEHTAFWILMIEDLGAQEMAKRTNDCMSYNNWHCCFVGRILIAVYAMRKFSRGCVHSLKYNPRPACAFYPRGNCSESQGRVNGTNMSWEKASNQCVIVYLFGQWTESSLISDCLFGNAKVCLSRIVCSVVLKFIGRTVCLLMLKSSLVSDCMFACAKVCRCRTLDSVVREFVCLKWFALLCRIR